ncbi:MAG: penicillin-binding protein, partial [Bacteroidetes bacterium]|nr:penicillin-binding protein [Bacteroidota bacterium]
VWVGGEVRQVHFRTMTHGQGARMAMPIFGDFINAINADTTLNYGEVEHWPKPEGELPFRMDCPDIKYDPNNPSNSGTKDDDDDLDL